MITEILLACLLVFITYSLVLRLGKFIEFRRKINKLPRMPDESLKTMLKLGMSKRDPRTFLGKCKDMFMDAVKLSEHSGKFFLIHSSLQTFTFILHPDAAGPILKSPAHVHKAGVLDLWTDWLGDSLAFSQVS